MTVSKQVFTGLKWSAGTQYSAQIVNWAITLVVIRLLTPADYGLIAIATGITAVLAVVSAAGMGAALIQHKELEPELPNKVFSLMIVSNLIFFIALFVSAPYIANLYGEPVLQDIIRALSLNHWLFPLIMINRAMLVREMDFRRYGIVLLVASVGGGVVTLALAYAEFSVWALVVGNIFANAVQLIGFVFVGKRWYRPIFKLKGMRKVITFGLTVTVDSFVGALTMQSDALILGRVLGKEPTGVFYVAKDLALLPMRKISRIINPIAFAGFSRVQHDLDEVVRYVLKAAGLIAMVAFPVFVGISSVSKELVAVVLGENWLDAIVPLGVLAPVGAFLMLGLSLEPAVKGIGRPIFNLYYRIVALVLVVAGVLIGVNWGVEGAAIGIAMAYTSSFFVHLLFVGSALRVPFRQYFVCIWKPLVASVVMYFAVYSMRAWLEAAQLNEALLLVLLIALGATTYAAALMLVDYRGVVNNVRLLRRG